MKAAASFDGGQLPHEVTPRLRRLDSQSSIDSQTSAGSSRRLNHTDSDIRKQSQENNGNVSKEAGSPGDDQMLSHNRQVGSLSAQPTDDVDGGAIAHADRRRSSSGCGLGDTTQLAETDSREGLSISRHPQHLNANTDHSSSGMSINALGQRDSKDVIYSQQPHQGQLGRDSSKNGDNTGEVGSGRRGIEREGEVRYTPSGDVPNKPSDLREMGPQMKSQIQRRPLASCGSDNLAKSDTADGQSAGAADAVIDEKQNNNTHSVENSDGTQRDHIKYYSSHTTNSNNSPTIGLPDDNTSGSSSGRNSIISPAARHGVSMTVASSCELLKDTEGHSSCSPHSMGIMDSDGSAMRSSNQSRGQGGGQGRGIVPPLRNLLKPDFESGGLMQPFSSPRFSRRPNRSEWPSLILLLVLYTIQGIPMGLGSSVPFLLQASVSYAQLGLFSLVSLPFSLKLLWAPAVDALYIPAIGRRKSWLLPTQMSCGLLMLLGGSKVDVWMGIAGVATANTPAPLDDTGAALAALGQPNVVALLCFFFILYLLMATQDIAVDGWSLTMLPPHLRGLSSSCNSIGQTLGYFIAYVGFLALQDAKTCNRWLRVIPSTEGMVSLGSFLRFWGAVIVCVTLVVALCREKESTSRQPSFERGGSSSTPVVVPRRKRAEDGVPESLQRRGESHTTTSPSKDFDEVAPSIPFADGAIIASAYRHPVEEVELTFVESYKTVPKLLEVSAVCQLLVLLVTCRIASAPVDAASQLKLVERGMTKEELAFFGPFLLPLGVIGPMVVGALTSGPRPLRWFSIGWKIRLGMCYIWLAMMSVTKFVYSRLDEDQPAPAWFYVILFLVSTVYNLSADIMFTAQMSFFAHVADPSIGGTYMTFLNTASNLGYRWTSTLSLWLMDAASLPPCIIAPRGADGFVVLTLICTTMGIFWWTCYARAAVRRLEGTKLEFWRIKSLRGGSRRQENQQRDKDI